MSAIIPTQFSCPKKITIRGVFQMLGIRYRGVGSFWHANQDQLEYLYVDFTRAARRRKAELHPDRTGDAESSARFNIVCDMVERGFRQRGIGPKRSARELAEMQERADLGLGTFHTYSGSKAYDERRKDFTRQYSRRYMRGYYQRNREKIRAYYRARRRRLRAALSQQSFPSEAAA